ncbi:MAG TPA: M1 family metallopeptidase [Chitinophagaceae bacterium]|nr:M1 family metallopeptidase [Chitinophagaceae bacterium]
MNKVIFFCIAGIMVWSNSLAQQLYMPRNIKAAYDKGTRSYDGKPGKNYFQNYGRYNISVTVKPPDRIIRGEEQIVYFNRSKHTLHNLFLRLILNVHKPGAVRESDVQPEYLTEGITIDSIYENGRPASFQNPTFHYTWQTFHLAKPLLPGDSVKLFIKWHYEIATLANREGAEDSTTYFMAYFHPRISVYDDYNGWDKTNFTDMQEFYNDFNDYTFSVTVPENFIVWATGVLQNPEEVLQPQIVQRYKQSVTSDEKIAIATAADVENKNVTHHGKMNTWKWKADYVSDIAVGISDHYIWDGASVIVDKGTGRRAMVQAAYKTDAQDFKHSIEFGQKALAFLSQQWPGKPYPYPALTAFLGSGDMEYPMMINDNDFKNDLFGQFLQGHETAHSYFPFYMGINENRYPFMDEGITTFTELLMLRSVTPVDSADRLFKRFRVSPWINDKTDNEDLPIITPGNAFSGVGGYGNNAYGKAALGYFALKSLLGDELFKKCLHEYMNRWNGKHPIPWDFFFSFNDVSGQNLNWFWNNWFFSNNYDDLAVNTVVKKDNAFAITVDNIGGFVFPFNVEINYTDGSKEILPQTTSVWKANPKSCVVMVKTGKKIKSVKIDNGIFMDAEEANNVKELK